MPHRSAHSGGGGHAPEAASIAPDAAAQTRPESSAQKARFPVRPFSTGTAVYAKARSRLVANGEPGALSAAEASGPGWNVRRYPLITEAEASSASRRAGPSYPGRHTPGSARHSGGPYAPPL